MKYLIGLHGKKQVGKDTIADYLMSEYDFVRIAFADPLKDAVAGLFNISREDVDEFKSNGEVPYAEVILQFNDTEWSWTWREFLQRFGTEMGRNTWGQDFWVDMWTNEYAKYKDKYNVVVTDARFENEAARILSFGGYIIEVTRPTVEDEDEHASEQRIDEELIDGWIDNNGTIDALHDDIDNLMEDIKNGKIVDFDISGRH